MAQSTVRRWHSAGLRWMPVALALLMMGLAAEAVSAERLRLTEAGEPAAIIVVPDFKPRQGREYQVAALLRDYIERMSGARLRVMRESQLGSVRIDEAGRLHAISEEVDETIQSFLLIGEGRLTERLGVNGERLGPGGIRLRTKGNTVVLIGGPAKVAGEPGRDPDGLRYAGIELLEQLGCRYLWPGELGMVVPSEPTLEVDAIDLTYTPLIRSRRIRWGRLLESSRSATGMDRLGIEPRQWRAGRREAVEPRPNMSWLQWHRDGGHMPYFGHAGGGLREGGQYLERRPEWFALQADGTRDQAGDPRWRLCISNPALIEHVASDIIERVNADPDITLVSLDPNDGSTRTSWCLCEDCKALDPPSAPTIRMIVYPTRERDERARIDHPSLTDRMLYYWNSIAERVTQVHPDLLFGVSANSAFARPPVQRKPHPNLVVRYVPSHTDYLEGWQEAGVKRLFWRPNTLLVNRDDGKLRSLVGELARNMRRFSDAGVIQTDFDSIQHNWATLGVTYYAAARLNWNPYLTADQIIADFARHGFGDGAAHIEQYIHRLEQLTEEGIVSPFQAQHDRRFTPDVVMELRKLLNAAAEAADDPVIHERIAFLRMGLNFTELHETLDELAWQARHGDGVDQDEAQKLVDLNVLMLRDMVLNHNLAINSGYLVWGSGNFAHLSRINGRTVDPSDEKLLDRIEQDRFGLTGYEDSLEDMLEAFGLRGDTPPDTSP